MAINFEAIFGKGKTDDMSVTTESITPIHEQKSSKLLDNVAVENLVIKYLNNANKRDAKSAKERINSVKQEKNINHKVFRIPEAEFQNDLIHATYKRNISFEKMEYLIKSALANNKKEASLEAQQEVFKILIGVESCKQAISALEGEMEVKYPNETKWIATNNTFDAGYKVDVISAIEDEKDNIKILNLVQVKSKESKDTTAMKDIAKTHQEYLNSLPQLIGILNKKEASASVEKEILDLENDPSKIEQMTLVGLIIDDYFSKIEKASYINAEVFYELYRKEGGTLNPFTIMGILKNQKVLEEYRKNGYFVGDKEKEMSLMKTADQIPFTEAESMVFHKKNHVKTILDSAVINSLVMVGNKIVFEQELKKPFTDKEEKE